MQPAAEPERWEYAFWNAPNHGQPLVPDYNLFWDNGESFNEENMQWKDNNIFDREPLFEEEKCRLREDSTGFNGGRSDILVSSPESCVNSVPWSWEGQGNSPKG